VKVLDQDGDLARVRAEGGQEFALPMKQLMLYSEFEKSE
jgi:hypothetical protein